MRRFMLGSIVGSALAFAGCMKKDDAKNPKLEPKPAEPQPAEPKPAEPGAGAVAPASLGAWAEIMTFSLNDPAIEVALRHVDPALADFYRAQISSAVAPVTVVSRAGETVVSTDEGPGKGKPDKIPSLKPAFAKDGTIDRKSVV